MRQAQNLELYAINYYKQLTEVFKKQGLSPTYKIDGVFSLINNLHKHGKILLLESLTKENECAATGIFVGDKNIAFYWGCAIYKKFQYLAPNEILMFEAIKFLKNNGATEFEFGDGSKYKEKYGPIPYVKPKIITSKYNKGMLFLKSMAKKTYYSSREVKSRIEKSLRSWIMKLRLIMAKLYYLIHYLVFEKQKGLDFISESGMFFSDPNIGYSYSTPPERTIRKLFYGYKVLPSDYILDIGCGKAYPLYIFTKLGFHRGHGIEISQQLCNIARNNISVLKLEEKITVECIDATIFDILDDFTYIYMFNPFPAAIMKKVVYNIENSLKRKPRNLIIIYLNPTCHETLINSEYLEFYEKRLVYARIRKFSINFYRYNWK